MTKKISWENEGNRAVRVRGELVEPGEAVDLEDPTPAELKMFGEEEEPSITKRKAKGRRRATAAEPEKTEE